MFPANKKSIAFVREWLTMWSSTPKLALPPTPIPRQAIPMCSTLEYASILL